jgi:hypothetical protein
MNIKSKYFNWRAFVVSNFPLLSESKEASTNVLGPITFRLRWGASSYRTCCGTISFMLCMSSKAMKTKEFTLLLASMKFRAC